MSIKSVIAEVAPDLFCPVVSCFQIMPCGQHHECVEPCRVHAYEGQHRDYSERGEYVADYREDAVAIHGETYKGVHRKFGW